MTIANLTKSISALLIGGLTMLTACCESKSTQVTVPEASLNRAGDAGPSVISQKPGQIDAVLKGKHSNSSLLTQRVFNYVLGGGVRGVGMLAYYPAPGPGAMQVRRITKRPETKEPYLPLTLVRVFGPNGNLCAVKELTEQEVIDETTTLTVPKGSEGIYRVSVSGGRQHDQYEITIPKTQYWGIRGEMALGLTGDSIKTGYIYVPRTVKMIIAEQFGNAKKDLVFYHGNKLLGKTEHGKSGRRQMILESPPTDNVLRVDLDGLTGNAITLDGVPGLICPTEEAARRLKGGAVEAEGMLVAGPLQARMRNWMASLKPEDLKVAVTEAKPPLADIKNPMEAALLYGKYAPLSGLQNSLAMQVIDPASPYMGVMPKDDDNTVPSWETFLHRGVRSFGASGALAGVATIDSPLNAYHNNQVIINRATLAAFYHMVSMQGDDLCREGDMRRNSYPITHVFFTYEAGLSAPLLLLKDKLSPEVYEMWKQGAMSVGDKLGDFQAYESNQWAHMIRGHLNTYLATGEKRFLGYFEREMRSYINNTWGPHSKFGQHPLGFYLEESGPDGNYDHLNSYCIVSCYLDYRNVAGADRKLVAGLQHAIEKNLEFKSFYWLQQPDGHIFSPNAFNCRTDALIGCPSYPGDYLAHQEFDLSFTRWLLNPTPSHGSGAGATFPHVINNEKWAKVHLESFVKKGGKAFDLKWFAGKWTPTIMDAYQLKRTAKQVTLPAQQTTGMWDKPGHMAFKQNGLYGIVFYALPGNRYKVAGKFGGGPTAFWNKDLGVFLASMRNAKKGKVENQDDVTFGCIAGTFQKKKFFYSGNQHGKLTWVKPGKQFEIETTLKKPRGKLKWRYTLADNRIDIDVCFKSNFPREAFMNLPIYTGIDGLKVSLTDSHTATVSRAGTQAIFKGEGTVELSKPLATTHKPVQCIRMALPQDGSWQRMTVELKQSTTVAKSQ